MLQYKYFLGNTTFNADGAASDVRKNKTKSPVNLDLNKLLTRPRRFIASNIFIILIDSMRNVATLMNIQDRSS